MFGLRFLGRWRLAAISGFAYWRQTATRWRKDFGDEPSLIEYLRQVWDAMYRDSIDPQRPTNPPDRKIESLGDAMEAFAELEKWLEPTNSPKEDRDSWMVAEWNRGGRKLSSIRREANRRWPNDTLETDQAARAAIQRYCKPRKINVRKGNAGHPGGKNKKTKRARA